MYLLVNCRKNNSDGELPAIVYMRKEVVGDDLVNTTLKGLGLKGGMSAAMRLFYKQPDTAKEQANVFIPAPQKSPALTEEIIHR